MEANSLSNVNGILWEISELLTQERIHRIFKLGGGVDHVTRHVQSLTKVKGSKVKVTMSRNVSAARTMQRKVISTSNLMEIFNIRGETRDTLSRSVGQLDRK